MALGKGLEALIPKKENPLSEFKKERFVKSSSLASESIFYIEIEKIKPNPYQPRRDFNEDDLRELADSIRQHGVIQPLVVTKGEKLKMDGMEVEYYLIAGERRLKAAQIVGLRQVPVFVKSVSEEKRLELALVENIQREDLDPIEKARAFQQLIEKFNFTHERIAKTIAKSRELVSNILRLINLPIEIQRAISAGKISEGHGRAILSLDNPEKQRALFREILEKALTVRQAENKVKIIKGELKNNISQNFDPEIKALEAKLEEVLGTKVSVKKRGKAGKIVIEFYSAEELDKFLEKIGC